MSIIVIGTIFNDIKGYPLGTFIPDGRNPGVMKIVHGGVARNAAEDLARSGLKPVFAALTDRSALAADVVKRLNESGVDTRFVFPSDAGMGTWMAIFDEKGDVAANISIRPDLAPLTSVLEEHHEEIFADADGIILEIDIEPETVERVFYYAEKYGKRIYALVSVMGIALERRAWFPRTECFICNLQEAGMLFDEDLSAFTGNAFAEACFTEDVPKDALSGDTLSEDALPKHIASLAKQEGFSKLIVTLGEHGAFYFDCRQAGADGLPLWGHCPAESVKVVDTTGAGDAFCAGASAALIAGRSLPDACSAGSRLSASVITSTENVTKGTVPLSHFCSEKQRK